MTSPSDNTLQQAWDRYHARHKRSATVADKYRYENIFAKGYIVANGVIGDYVPANWTRLELQRGYNLAVAPDLGYSYLSESNCSTLVLGHAFHKKSGSTKTAETVAVLHEKLVADRNFDSFEKTVLDTSGRYVAIAIRGSEARVYTDPMATLTCFWGQTGRWKRTTYLASHSALIAHATGNTEVTENRWIMRHPDYSNPGGKTLPALIAPHDCTTEVIANCYLSIQGSKVTHVRYFPKHELESLSLDEATDVFMDEMRFNMEAWLGVADHSYLALTAGQDSRAILSASLDLLIHKSEDVTLMTYHFFKKGAATTATDLLKANQMALDAGLRFKVIDIDGVAKEVGPLYNATFPAWARFPTLTSSFYEQLQADSALFIGVGGEIGTVFFTGREQSTITPEWLAKKYAYSKVSEDPELIKKFQDYIEYTQFTDDRLHGYDLHDLFYWEHRLTKWAGASYAEYDLAAIVALPFNSRRLILAMLSLPYQQRVGRAIYAEVVKRSGIK